MQQLENTPKQQQGVHQTDDDRRNENKQNTTYLAVGDMDTVHYSTLTFCVRICQLTKRNSAIISMIENENTHARVIKSRERKTNESRGRRRNF